MDTPSPHATNIRRPHPLAVELVERLRAQPNVRVLELGKGSGRNTAALAAAGFSVYSTEDDSTQSYPAAFDFDAAISTHALLHGTPHSIAQALTFIARALKEDAPLYATFASKRDARFGRGARVADDAFAPDAGEERGVPHAYFDEPGLRRMLEAHFSVEAIEERDVDEIVGSWAHEQRPQGSVHWFVRARKPKAT